jgi:excinuclease ABC subunit B
MLRKLVDALYSRSEVDFQRGNFRVKGDTVDIFPAYADESIRIVFFGDEIEEISVLIRFQAKKLRSMDEQLFIRPTFL